MTAVGPAVKLSVSAAMCAPAGAEEGSFQHCGVAFTRVWLQGVVVAATESPAFAVLVLDDGSGVMQLRFAKEVRGGLKLLVGERPLLGLHLLVTGKLSGSGGLRCLRVHNVNDLSAQPDRESLWNLELVELWRDTYRLVPPQPSTQASS